MIVTAGARHGERHGASGDDIDAVVDDVGLVIEKAAANGEETEGGEISGVRPGHLIGGDLGDEKLIVGKILIEGADHPISVSVGVGVAAFFLEDIAFGIGVAGDIQPVATPAFAVVG